MRERKYKVWDKEECRWLELSGNTCLVYVDGKMQVLEGDENYAEVHENVEIVDYTGFKDKHTKEIYEGDIIQSQLDKNIVGVVTYGKYAGHTGFHVNWKGGMHKELLHRDLAFWTLISEIIGNIFENPKLLEN